MEHLSEDLAEARAIAERMRSHIEQALESVDLPEAKMHLREAMAAGEEMEFILADSVFDAEDHAVAAEMERGLGNLRSFFRLGVEALSGEDEKLRDRIAMMKPLAIEAEEHVRDAAVPLGM